MRRWILAFFFKIVFDRTCNFVRRDIITTDIPSLSSFYFCCLIQAAEEAEYVSKAKVKLLTLQIADSLTNRRPSNAELYGDEEEGSLPSGSKPGSRVQSGTSAGTNYDPPPPLALPNEAKDGGGSGNLAPPVILRETSADDRLAIANAAERKDVVREALLRTHVQRGHSPSSDTDGSGPGRAIKSSDDNGFSHKSL